MLRYEKGDTVVDPISYVIGVIYEVIETDISVQYRVYWNNPDMNHWSKRLWDHYEITLIPRRAAISKKVKRG
jgi:hypothetical protein